MTYITDYKQVYIFALKFARKTGEIASPPASARNCEGVRGTRRPKQSVGPTGISDPYEERGL